MSAEDLSVKIVIDADGKPAVTGINDARQAVAGLGNTATLTSAKITGLDAAIGTADDAAAGFSKTLLGFAGYLAVDQLLNVFRNVTATADDWKMMAARIGAANEHLTDSQARLRDVADVAIRTNSALGGTAELYAALERASGASNASQAAAARLSAENLTITGAINNALRMQGTTSAAAAGGLLQLSQAFESGVLRGEEFNSVNESMPAVLYAVAKSLGVTKGELRTLAEQGALTADVVRRAILESADDWQAAAAKLPVTLDAALTNMSTKWSAFIGQSKEVATVSGVVGEAINGVANHLQGITSIGVDVALIAIAKALQAGAEKSAAWAAAQYEGAQSAKAAAEAARFNAEADARAAAAKELSAKASVTLARNVAAEADGWAALSAEVAATATTQQTQARSALSVAEANLTAARSAKQAADAELLRLGSIEGVNLRTANAAAFEARLTAAREQASGAASDVAFAEKQVVIERERLGAADQVAAAAETRLTAARTARTQATRDAAIAEALLRQRSTEAALAAERAALIAQEQANSWRQIATVGGAVNATLAVMISYDVGKWIGDWARGTELGAAAARGLDAALSAVSDTYRGLLAVEAQHADRQERETAMLRRVNEQTGANITSLEQLKKAVEDGTIVQNAATGAWERGTQALKAHATALGAVDTAFAKAGAALADYGKRQSEAAKAADAQAAAAIAVAKAADQEALALKLTADARAQDRAQAQQALDLSRAELANAQARLTALVNQKAADDAGKKAREDQIKTLTDEVTARRNAVTQAEAQATASRAAAESAELEADTYGNQAGQVNTLIAGRDKLTEAIRKGAEASAAGQQAQTQLAAAQAEARRTAEAYTAVLTGQAQGDLPALAKSAADAQAVVTRLTQAVSAGAAADAAAAGIREQLTATSLRLADAARDAADAQERLQASIQREATIATAQAGVQLAELARRREMAAAHRDQSAAADYAMAMLRQEAQVSELGAAAKAKEADALREKARLMQIAAQANGEYTDAEQALVAQTRDAATMLDLEGKALIQTGLAKRDQIILAQELAEQERQLSQAFTAAGEAGVKSMDDARRAIADAADGDELARLKNALREVWESGALAQEEYKQALDEIMAKQDQLDRRTKTAGRSLFDPAALDEQFNGDRNAIAKYVVNWVTHSGGIGAAGGGDKIMRFYDEWKAQQAAASQAQTATATPAAAPATGAVTHVAAAPARTVRVELVHAGQTAPADVPEHQAGKLIETIRRAGLAAS